MIVGEPRSAQFCAECKEDVVSRGSVRGGHVGEAMHAMPCIDVTQPRRAVRIDGSAVRLSRERHHANLAAAAPITPTVIFRPSFSRVPPGMRSIHPHKWQKRGGSVLDHKVAIHDPPLFWSLAAHM